MPPTHNRRGDAGRVALLAVLPEDPAKLRFVGFVHQLIADAPTLMIGVDHLLKGGLAVLGGGLIPPVLRAEDVFFRQHAGLVQPSVQVYSGQHRFEGVGQDGILVPASALFLSPAEQQILPQHQAAGSRGQSPLADQGGAQPCHCPLPHLGMGIIDVA